MAKQPAKKVIVATPVVENKTAVNRAKRLARHLKQHPNDAQALVASKTTKAPRKASKTKGNFPAQKHPVRDESGKVVGFASYSSFSFYGSEMVQNEKGNWVQNPEVKEAWNKYKSKLANAAVKGRRKHDR
jgi:hypothetical protein